MEGLVVIINIFVIVVCSLFAVGMPIIMYINKKFNRENLQMLAVVEVVLLVMITILIYFYPMPLKRLM